MFIRNESFYSFRKNYPIVFSLVIIHIVLFAWINLTSLTNGLIPFGDTIFQLGVGFNAAIAAGELWRLITPVFLHQGLTHVILNSFALVLFAPPLEKMIGRSRFIIVYVLMGLLANVATFFLGGLYYSHLGASGAVFGVFGIYMYLIWKRKDLIDAASAQLILILTLFSVVMTFLSPNINVYAHILGFFPAFCWHLSFCGTLCLSLASSIIKLRPKSRFLIQTAGKAAGNSVPLSDRGFPDGSGMRLSC
ncbi:rhomboid family intramembrane serine protease [Sinobaca sp. H24]|uniref:rhomboid family intramembrane serine protease n=1 Tax=Sinobaca sp. H24 TaxID=2923376 RepID=UPI00207AD575|nr:rhomboid family intramembrane serine protease [Sinobaca sp. H24]